VATSFPYVTITNLANDAIHAIGENTAKAEKAEGGGGKRLTAPFAP